MSMAISGNSAVGSVQAISGASSRMSMDQKMSDVFDKIDAGGSGSIGMQQFAQAFQNLNAPASFKSMGADAIFNQLDTKGTGSVSKQDFINGMKNLAAQLRHSNSNANNPSPVQTVNASLNSLNGLGSNNRGANGSNTDYFV